MRNLPLRLGILITLVFVCAATVRADQFYQVNGTLTTEGNDVCGGPCILTVDYSYELDTVNIQGGYSAAVIESSAQETGAIPGAFYVGGWHEYVGSVGYIQVFSTETTNGTTQDPLVEIDMFVDASNPYSAGAIWFQCWGECATDFVPPGPTQDVGYNVSFYGAPSVSLTQSVSLVPEGSMTPMMIAGLLFLIFLQPRPHAAGGMFGSAESSWIH